MRRIGLIGGLLLVGCSDHSTAGTRMVDGGTGGTMAGDGGRGATGGASGGTAVDTGGLGGGLDGAVDSIFGSDGTGGGGGTYPDAGQIAAVQIRAHERVTFVGDSLTSGYNGALSWPTGSGNFIDQVNAILGAGNEIVATEYGVPSIGIDYLMANLSTMVFASDPTLVFLWIGTNDAAGAGTDNFKTKYAMYLAQLKAWKPTVKILTLGLGPRGSEYWQRDGSGNPMWNPIAPSLDTYDADIQEASASMGATFVDWRKWLLAWEVIHNPGAAQSGFATVDGTHYNDAGQKQLAAVTLQPKYVSVFP